MLVAVADREFVGLHCSDSSCWRPRCCIQSLLGVPATGAVPITGWREGGNANYVTTQTLTSAICFLQARGVGGLFAPPQIYGHLLPPGSLPSEHQNKSKTINKDVWGGWARKQRAATPSAPRTKPAFQSPWIAKRLRSGSWLKTRQQAPMLMNLNHLKRWNTQFWHGRRKQVEAERADAKEAYRFETRESAGLGPEVIVFGRRLYERSKILKCGEEIKFQPCGQLGFPDLCQWASARTLRLHTRAHTHRAHTSMLLLHTRLIKQQLMQTEPSSYLDICILQ